MSTQPQPPSAWPGWDRDLVISARHSARLARRLIRRAVPLALAREWAEVTGSPQRVSPGDADSFIMTRAGAEASRVISEALSRIWRDGWVLGASSAYQLARPVNAVKASEKYRPVTCDMGHDHDSHAAAGLLIRSRNDDGKRVYLLHKRPDGGERGGTWVTPGGGLMTDEEPFSGAMREATEEIGTLPRLSVHHAVVQDHGGWSYTTYVMDARKPFTPVMDGSTPEEVAGWGWFTKKEIRGITLSPGLDDGWDAIRRSDEDTYVNSCMGKSWRYRRFLPGTKPAETPPDPRRAMTARLMRAGVPRQAAMQLAGKFLAWEESQAASRSGIIRTLVTAIAGILRSQGEGKITADEAAAELRKVIESGPRAARIALTELSRAAGAAALDVYVTGGIEQVSWVTARDADVCPSCALNAAESPVPVSQPFPSGDMTPPAHPHCRCAIIPAEAKVSEVPGSADWTVLPKSAETPVVSTVHRPLGREGLWHTPSRKVPVMQELPAYIQNTARALMRDHGLEESQAIATAVNAVKDWAAGRAFGGRVKVTPEVRAAARRAISEWELLRAAHKCLTCGCHRPDDDHGDHRHITLHDLQAAAEAADETTAEAVRNIIDTLAPMPVTGNPWLSGSRI